MDSFLSKLMLQLLFLVLILVSLIPSIVVATEGNNNNNEIKSNVSGDISNNTSNLFVSPTGSYYGNELEQLENYFFMTKDQVGNESELMESFSKCEKGVIIDFGWKGFLCRFVIRNELIAKRSMLWNHTMNGHAFARDCEYLLTEFSHSFVVSNDDEMLFSFVIEQYGCKSKLPFDGGSTFEISATGSDYLGLCQTIDYFDNRYLVNCRVPKMIHTDNSQLDAGIKSLCLTLDVVVHFEHYDAFSDVAANDFVTLHHRIYHGPMCTGVVVGNHAVLNTTNQAEWLQVMEDAAKQYDTFNLWQANRSSNFGWLKWPNDRQERFRIHPKFTVEMPAGSIEKGFTHPRSTILGAEYFPELDYHWQPNQKNHLTISGFNKCTENKIIVFAGESHVRYHFDLTVNRYIARDSFDRHHGDIDMKRAAFVMMTFSARLAKYLNGETCDPSGKAKTYIVQTASWDFQFFPVRGFLRSPYQARAVIEAIDKLLTRTKSCPGAVEVIYLNSMPHPWCLEKQTHCMSLMNYHRNNAAIRAANTFVERALLALNHSSLHVIDTHRTIMPRFPLSEYACVDHFVCNEAQIGLETTPIGVAYSSQVLRFACRDEIANDNDALFQDGHLYREVTSNRQFVVHQGCRREIPDVHTGQHMGFTADQFEVVSEAFLANIPLCFAEKFPSRMTGRLYRPFGSRTVYCMDDGLRRPVHDAWVIEKMGLTFENVTILADSDIEAIPIGPMLVHAEEIKIQTL